MSTLEEIQAYYDQVADTYDERARSNPYIKMLDSLTWKWIRRHLPADHDCRILDAGGGTGKWAIPLARLGYRVTLLDISARMLRIAEKKIEVQGLKHLIDIREGNMEETDFPSEFFDFILCEGDAIGLTQHPVKALSEFKRILKVNGLVSLNICNHYKLFPLMIQKMKNIEDVEKYFKEPIYGREPLQGAKYQVWRPEEILKLLRDAGFKIGTYAPRMVLVDLLSEEIVKAMKDDEEILRRVQQLEEKFIQRPVLAALGGHIMIVARKVS